MLDLRFVFFETPGYSRTKVTSTPPPEVTVKSPYWFYRGQSFVIGHGVRAPEDGECEGPLFVYDHQCPKQRTKARCIRAELAKRGRLVIN